MNRASPQTSPRPLPRVSATWLKMFAAYSGHYLRRRFHSIRILKNGLPPHDPSRPLVVYLNHASWWDPLACLLLARQFFPQHTSFAPIDEATLDRYKFFKRLGFFGIEQKSPRGASKFLSTAHALLGSARHAIWITPQGRFMDVRERPLRLQSGLGALAAQSAHAIFIPLALEYTFWSEPRPELLLSFGEPITPAHESPGDAAEWTNRFSTALAATQDALAECSCRRNLDEWLVLDRGASGVNSIYDTWRWLRARMSRQKFSRAHQAEFLP